MTDEWRAKRLADGLCLRCPNSRTAIAGYTSTMCAACRASVKTTERNRQRKKRGIPIDAPVRAQKSNGTRNGSPKTYGTLSREEIRTTTSILPLKPPGK